ncbi:MAG: DUF1963 domain-containing protein [Corynebacterium sp.]|nr:DUF1963 domain-containing protein [Corynebacterium sp.]
MSKEKILEFPVPAHLSKFRDFLDKHARYPIALILRGVPIHNPNHIPGPISSHPTGSRIGGPAFITPKSPWPRDRHGKRMLFFAQINLADIPSLPGYRSDGLLQFFIGDHGYYGMEDDDFNMPENFASPHNRAVRYIPSEEYPIGRIEGGLKSQANNIENGYFRIKPVIYKQYPNPTDLSFERIFEFDGSKEEDEFISWLTELHYHGPQAIFGGGWAKLCQYDRYGLTLHDTTLLRVNNVRERTTNVKLVWGDEGTGNFFINPKDLAEWNFDNVVYYWDYH